MYKVEQISTEETYSIRHEILRKGKPLETCYFQGDDEAETIHLGLYDDLKLIGIVTFMNQTNTVLPYSRHSQLRGMAISKEYQGRGLGELLVKKGEQLLKQKKYNYIWLNSREKAINFYKRQNYIIKGDSFEIKDIGTHYFMYKKLD